MTKLVGYKRFTSKKSGKEFCVASVLQDLTDRERTAGAVGQKVDEIFLPEEQYNFLKPEHIGKNIDLEYEMSGGKAFLVNVCIAK